MMIIGKDKRSVNKNIGQQRLEQISEFIYFTC